MRRAERAVTGLNEIESILKRCEVCRLALHDDPYPYIVPLSFGYGRDGERLWLYFHCAHEGMKLNLMQKRAQAAFEMDCACKVIQKGQSACAYTMRYESVVGQGVLSRVQGAEKADGLSALMRHAAPKKAFDFSQAALDGVTVLRLDVHSLTAKRNLPGEP
ncbi:MAG: pyridoxamine 5'-phosphate oxidase family protein [Firmicutes bacterium]|nr:pyridoxamine 5'-phosphate oxidase family protein [Bacillota bacterium]